MAAPDGCARLRINVYGAVQGVGFRPYVYRLARRLGLRGSVLNSSAGVIIEVEGDPAVLEEFASRLPVEKPQAAQIASLETCRLDPAGEREFVILESDPGAGKTAVVLPDRATCPACLREIFDPRDRRFGYPFTNCTDCGPRYTIVRDIPYDRPNTTMERFRMCPACRREYGDPGDRRFQAQPNACPDCGPRLDLVTATGVAVDGDPLEGAAALIKSGGILALKGIGGFQLLVDAARPDAVRRLRERKHREEKPFAVMFPSIESVRRHCRPSAAEEALLQEAASPIVLLRPHPYGGLAAEVSLSSPYVGAMLPCSPLHHLLLAKLGLPVVATSGNRSDEPIAFDDHEARRRLGAIADAFLRHDRPIARPCDDSVARVLGRGETVLRRARGYAPLPIPLRRPAPRILALGAHLKNAPAIAVGRQVFLSQHIGDLETEEARDAFRRAIDDLSRLYAFAPEAVACDLHPDYFTTRHAESLGLPLFRVQHHQAHLASCAAENGLDGAYLGVAWDGTGYGLDGTIWGGEFLAWDGAAFTRVARLRPFQLPGGESAVRDGRRSAYGLLSQVSGPEERAGIGLTEKEEGILRTLVRRSVNAPWTSSVGRLFDAVAAIAGVAERSRFEGQAAMRLEAALDGARGDDAYPLPLVPSDRVLDLDWRPLIGGVARDAGRGAGAARIALRFHNALVDGIVAVARDAGLPRVVLSGGVFQNAYLAARGRERLEAAGFRVYAHQRVPPNDGGIALGQVVLASLASGGSPPFEAAREGRR